MSLTKIGSIGINTGIAFAGVTTIATLNGSDAVLSVGGTVNFVSDVSIGGTVSIAGTLTYEDVTNVDAVGLITARDGIVVGSGITLSKDGDVFFTGIATGNGSGLTALNASNIGSGTVPTARLGSGTASSSTFLRGDSSFQTVNTDLVSDTSPQLGGNLASNGNEIVMADNDKIKIGTGSDLQLYHTGFNSYIRNLTGDLYIQTNDGSGSAENGIAITPNGAVDLYHNNVKTFETDANGIKLLGPEGGEAEVNLFADEGDDNADKWRIQALAAGGLNIQNFTSGSWENNLIANGNGAVELYHDNTKQFETVSGGVKVHGTYEVNWAGGSSTYWWENSDLASTSSWVATKGGSGGNLVNTQGGTNGLTYSSSDSLFNGYKSIRMASGGAGGLRTSTESSGTYWNGTEAWTVMVVFEQTGHSGGSSYGDGLFCQNVNTSSSTDNNGSWSVAPYGDHTWGGSYGEQFAYTGDHEPLSHMAQPFKGIFMYRTYGFEHSELSVNFGGGWIPIQLAHAAPSSLGTTFTNISFLNFQQSSSSHEFIGGIAEMAYWKGTRVGGKELESISSYLCNKFQL